MDPRRARRLLEAERERLRGILDGPGDDQFGDTAQEEASDVLSYSGQPADAGQELYNREHEQSLRHHAEAELDEIEHALRKLDDGTYGLDERTGEAIPDERLEARPAARYTVDNQERDERVAGVHNETGAPNARGAADPTAT